MPVPRNNLARLPWPVREAACRIMFDGGTNADVQETVAEACAREGIAAPAIHGTTVLAYRKADEYRRYCERRREGQARQTVDRLAWAAISADGGASSAVQAARYLALREIVGQLQTGELTPGDTARLTGALAKVSADALAEAKRDWAEEREAIEADHAQELAALKAAIAERDATIAALRQELTGAAKAGGLTPETIQEIEHRLKLL